MFWTRNDKKLNTKLMKEIPSPSIYLQNTYNTYHITKDEQQLYDNLETIQQVILNKMNNVLENLHLNKQKTNKIQQIITKYIHETTNQYLTPHIQKPQTQQKLEQIWHKYTMNTINELHITILVHR